MSFSPRPIVIRTLAVLAALGLAAGWVVWRCESRPEIHFLSDRQGAQWIVYPYAPDGMLHQATEWSGTFRRTLTLPAAPAGAVLSVRAFKSCAVSINGRPVVWPEVPAKNWKQIREASVSGYLQAGSNTLEVTVMNREGPPAVWLRMAAGIWSVVTDTNWTTSLAGAEWRAAVPATSCRPIRPGNRLAGSERTVSALADVWPLLILWTAIAAAVVGGYLLWHKHSSGATRMGRVFKTNPDTVVLLLIVGLWTLLFWHNLPLLPHRPLGFDAADHLEYIQYIRQSGSLPLANDGFQMFQPPLFYVINAGALTVLGLSTADPAGLVVMRVLMALIGIAPVIGVFFAARLWFSESPAKRVVCLLLAGFVPMLLYLSHYLTNEVLAAAFGTAAIVISLHTLRSPQPSLISGAGIGLCLGAAVLTKVTAILIAPAIVCAFAARLLTRRQLSGAWFRTLCAMGLMAAAVCAWHYVRVWLRFGTPLVFSWDDAAGFSWWQDEGYRTSAFFTRFGQVLVDPSFAGLDSFFDGMYSTLWGDGLWGGIAELDFRAPWNGNLMAVGYLLALVPMVLVLLGATSVGWRWLRQPRAEDFLLLCVAMAFAGALVFNCLEVPYSAAVKAFYALPALVPFCVFGATGFGWLARNSRSGRCLLAVLLTVWALNTLASHWIRPGSSQTQLCLGLHEAALGRVPRALEILTHAAEQHPADARLWRAIAMLFVDQGSYDEARFWAEKGLRLHPDDPGCRVHLAEALAQQGNCEPALVEFRRLMDEIPDNTKPYQLAAYCLGTGKRTVEAIETVRRGLAVAPANPDLQQLAGVLLLYQGDSAEPAAFLRRAIGFGANSPRSYLDLAQALVQQHELNEAVESFFKYLEMVPGNAGVRHQLAVTLLQLGRAQEAALQFREALALAPDSPEILNNLAWLRATHPDANLRDGKEAVALAERACALTQNKVVPLLGTLAAAYAEAGRFQEAVDAARRAVSLAQEAGDTSAAAQHEALLKQYQRGLPFHEPPPP